VDQPYNLAVLLFFWRKLSSIILFNIIVTMHVV